METFWIGFMSAAVAGLLGFWIGFLRGWKANQRVTAHIARDYYQMGLEERKYTEGKTFNDRFNKN